MKARIWIGLAIATLVLAGCTDRSAEHHWHCGTNYETQLPPSSTSGLATGLMNRHFQNVPEFCHDVPLATFYSALNGEPDAEPGDPLGSLCSGDGGNEELWVIERPSAPGDVAAAPDRVPGSGALLAHRDATQQDVPCPLEHTDVQAQVCGPIGTVTVTQRFKNPFSEKIEAVYVFPLPHDAAVNEFIMTVGERRIRGIIRDRQEAERIYSEARAQGYVASLLTQERPNVFTQKVANIEPGKAIDVNITYVETMAYADGGYELVFPMVVGPRFNPPSCYDGVAPVPRGGAGTSGQPVEVSYLKPGERTGHDISLSVDLDAGVAIEGLASPSHAVTITRTSVNRAKVVLDAEDRIPNKDFVLRWKVAGDAVKTAFLTHRDARGGFFTLMICPPADLDRLPRQPMEMVFQIDCSGSMSGGPLAKAKQVVRSAITRLHADDTFQVIRFGDTPDCFVPAPIAATEENVQRGLRYLDSLQAAGGTMMVPAIRVALGFPRDPQRLRTVFFLTDGYVGNEREVFQEVARPLGDARVFSFGIGQAPSRYLLEGVARMGRGAVAYVGLEEGTGRAVEQFFREVDHPALTDVSIDWDGIRVSETFPSRIPDLFVGRPIVLAGRFKGSGRHHVRVTGMAGGRTMEVPIDVDLDDSTPRPALPSIWARMEIRDLAFRAIAGDESEMAQRIKSVALEYGLMSSYTAFLAVDTLTRTQGDHGTTVNVPVPVPEGVRYDTTVPEGNARPAGGDHR